MKRLLIIVSICILISSCATHNGTISSSISNRYVRYDDIAYGVSQSNSYFGIGGLSNDAMVLEAKRVLMNSRPLNINEGYANFSVDTKRIYFLFYCSTKVTVTADVVNFVPDTLSLPFSSQYRKKLLGSTYSNSLFEIGDSIIELDNEKGILLAYKNNAEIRILYKTPKDRFKTKFVFMNSIFSLSKNYKGYKIGDKYLYETIEHGMTKQNEGEIIGLGMNMILIKDKNGKNRLVNYKNNKG